ncbi:MAG: 3-hydroxyacyl-ACP dehydratase FabZ [Desulfocapsaceae bacterium]|nr:3-hydroxyacyl-ACP dehydratase FabZ [Desulfocapsaceae bacterium]
MSAESRITALIPHREPFLWVDRIVATTDRSIVTEKDIPADLDVFKGHYPDHPILPGVLLCEAVFQTGALLSAQMDSGNTPQGQDRMPVVTRIGGARFKRPVLPGDTIRMNVELTETVSSVCFYKGTVRVNDKVALKIEFATTLADSGKKNQTTL